MAAIHSPLISKIVHTLSHGLIFQKNPPLRQEPIKHPTVKAVEDAEYMTLRKMLCSIWPSPVRLAPNSLFYKRDPATEEDRMLRNPQKNLALEVAQNITRSIQSSKLPL